MSESGKLVQSSSSDLKEFQQMLFEEKQRNPSQFVSHWEADENDIEESTEEDRKRDPVKQFLWAAETGDLKILSEMLSSNPQLVSACDNDGYTSLHRAAYEGKLEAAKLLLARGADVNAVTNDGWTPLHSSCFWGHTEISNLFIRWKGCNVNAKTSGLQTPLHLAAQNCNNLMMFKLLLMNSSINSSEMNQVGEKPVDIAVRNTKFHELFLISDDSINIL